MVLVIANAFDVVPGGRLVAQITLVDFGVRLTSDLGRDHLKMHHVMARRRLMALSAVLGCRRRMPKFRDRPFRRRVTLRTILAEELDVPILGGMASRAIQDRLLRGEARMTFQPVTHGLMLTDPGEEIFPHPFVFTVWRMVGLQLAEADLRQRQMVHLGRLLLASPMLGVALDAATHVGMKRGRLAFQQ